VVDVVHLFHLIFEWAEPQKEERKHKQTAALSMSDQEVSDTEMWTKPKLCRLCEFPAVDGRVRVDQLNIAKLSTWWHRVTGAEFEAEEIADDAIICHFCIWDARCTILFIHN
jgi:hypothetical protein